MMGSYMNMQFVITVVSSENLSFLQANEQRVK